MKINTDGTKSLMYKITDSAFMYVISNVQVDTSAGTGNIEGVWIYIYRHMDPYFLVFESSERIKLFELISCRCPNINSHIERDSEINCGNTHPLSFNNCPKVKEIGALKGILTPAKYKEIYTMIKDFIDVYNSSQINIDFMTYLKNSINLPRYEITFNLVESAEKKEEGKK